MIFKLEFDFKGTLNDIDYMDIEEYKKLKNHANDVFALIDSQPLRINVIYYAARGKLKEVAHSMILAGLLGEKVI